MTLESLIDQALEEDMPNGDITTEGLGLASRVGRCELVAKQDLIVSGRDFFEKTVLKLDPKCELNWSFGDGDAVSKGQVVCEISGDFLRILKGERVALNFLGRLSGIATLTKKFVEVAGDIKILDTRKTTPLYREFEKKAVIDGGGSNHRMNLSDAILVKENHIRAAGGLEKALRAIRKSNPEVKIEVEVTDLSEAKEAIKHGAYRLLLDNMSNEELAECIDNLPSEIVTEASGNMTVERVKSLRDHKLDYISVGAITHSAPVADYSLLFQWDD